MATHLIVYGHGAGDPGAVGNGENERDFNRKKLHPYIVKWVNKSKHNFVFYDTSGSKDMFQDTANGWGMYSIRANQYASVTEVHEDAASPSATGGHVIVSSSFNADKQDLDLAKAIQDIVGLWGGVSNTKGISYRNNLLNLNVAAQRGITYRLMELGFITSKRDMDIIRRDLDKYAKYIVERITGENLGGTTMNKKDMYHQTGVFFKAKRDLPTYINDQFSKKSEWMFAKGSVFGIRKVFIGSKGNTHAYVDVNGGTIRVTLHKDWVEKIK